MTFSLTLPHWIGRRRNLFASFHGPISDARDLGVVLCKSFGHEMMSTHRAFRHLAERLAEGGFPTLRFDYDGTGDSSGSDLDPERFERWIESLDDAVRALQRRGARRIALVGLRFGALLAMDYAKRHPVESLVLIGPPASGKTYLRELRAIQSLKFGQAAEGNAEGVAGEEVLGFFLRSEAAERLAAVASNQAAATSAPARRALIVPRDDLPGAEHRLAERLTAHGTQVTVSSAKGYAAMVDPDPVKAAVPQAMWKEVVQWLDDGTSETVPPVSGHGYSRVAEVQLTEDEPVVSEEIFDVGGMLGILSRPPRPIPNAPLVVLPNTGANYHVGSNRMYVEFGRQWAALGFPVMRFDLTGIGDSPAAPGHHENDIYSDASIADAGRVLRWASEVLGAERFVLGGVCSGAYVSYYAALANTSVVGALLLNPLTFKWLPGDSLESRGRATLKSTDFYVRAAFEVETWSRIVRQGVHWRAIAPVIAGRAWRRISRWGQTDTADDDVAVGFRKLAARGTRVVLACGEDDASRDVVAEHLGAAACDVAHPTLRFEIVRNTDHTFAPAEARRTVGRILTRHLLGDRSAASVAATHAAHSAATGSSRQPAS